MKKEFNVIIERDEDGFYVATVPTLKGCHTQAKSLDDLMKRIKEAIELCVEEKGTQHIHQYDFIGVQKITVNEKSVKYVSNKKSGKITSTIRRK